MRRVSLTFDGGEKHLYCIRNNKLSDSCETLKSYVSLARIDRGGCRKA